MVRRALMWSAVLLLISGVCPPATLAATETMRFTLGWQPTINGARFFLAEAEGLFAKEDLDVQLLKFNSGAAFFAAFQSSSIDVGFFGIPPAATAVAQGIPIKIVAVECDSGDAEGLVARQDSGIKTLSDLRGKKSPSPVARRAIRHCLWASPPPA
jgi:taurine transport system substrate-binding protein